MLQKIKMLTVRALVSDENLMYSLVLKGGNALQLVYDMTDRASMDLDFSIAGDFSEEERIRIESRLHGLLNSEFEKHDLVVFDIKFIEKPKQRDVKEWKGYKLTFKTVDYDKYDPSNLPKTRNLAYKIMTNNSTQFTVEISGYEFTEPKKKVEVEGAVIFVYTPEMIVFEKLRALCQSMPDYKKIIPTARPKGRARDFYDIWNICQNYDIDFSSEYSRNLLKEIFEAKLVPLDFLSKLKEYKDLQKEDWNNVSDTLTTENKGFDFYYNFVSEKVELIKSP